MSFGIGIDKILICPEVLRLQFFPEFVIHEFYSYVKWRITAIYKHFSVLIHIHLPCLYERLPEGRQQLFNQPALGERIGIVAFALSFIQRMKEFMGYLNKRFFSCFPHQFRESDNLDCSSSLRRSGTVDGSRSISERRFQFIEPGLGIAIARRPPVAARTQRAAV